MLIATAGKQVPWDQEALRAHLYLVAAPVALLPVPSPAEIEAARKSIEAGRAKAEAELAKREADLKRREDELKAAEAERKKVATIVPPPTPAGAPMMTLSLPQDAKAGEPVDLHVRLGMLPPRAMMHVKSVADGSTPGVDLSVSPHCRRGCRHVRRFDPNKRGKEWQARADKFEIEVGGATRPAMTPDGATSIVKRAKLEAAPRESQEAARIAKQKAGAEGRDVAKRDPAMSVVPGSGKSFRDPLKDGIECMFCPEMVVVPPGSLMMGSPESEGDRVPAEGPQRQVTIARPFAVGKFEVTFAEWDACVADKGCARKPGANWGAADSR